MIKIPTVSEFESIVFSVALEEQWEDCEVGMILRMFEERVDMILLAEEIGVNADIYRQQVVDILDGLRK